MTAPTIQPHPWGECVHEKCHFVGMRCHHDRCETHCAKECKDPTGVKLHSTRTKAETDKLMPIYSPTKPKLLATTRFHEEKAE